MGWTDAKVETLLRNTKLCLWINEKTIDLTPTNETLFATLKDSSLKFYETHELSNLNYVQNRMDQDAPLGMGYEMYVMRPNDRDVYIVCDIRLTKGFYEVHIPKGKDGLITEDAVQRFCDERYMLFFKSIDLKTGEPKGYQEFYYPELIDQVGIEQRMSGGKWKASIRFDLSRNRRLKSVIYEPGMIEKTESLKEFFIRALDEKRARHKKS